MGAVGSRLAANARALGTRAGSGNRGYVSKEHHREQLLRRWLCTAAAGAVQALCKICENL